MSRYINEKCLKCASLTAQEARQLHGVEGDGCWDDLKCHKRRSHYRNRSDRNTKRMLKRDNERQDAQTNSQPEVVPVNIEVAPVPRAILVFYSEKPHNFKKTTELHAVGAELWVGTEQKAKIEPIHTMALSSGQIRQLFVQILEALSKHHGGKPIMKYYTVVYRHVQDCPTRPCPFH